MTAPIWHARGAAGGDGVGSGQQALAAGELPESKANIEYTPAELACNEGAFTRSTSKFGQGLYWRLTIASSLTFFIGRGTSSAELGGLRLSPDTSVAGLKSPASVAA